MWTVEEAARRLGRSPELVRRWLREGRLVGERFGGVWIVREKALSNFTRSEPQRRYYKVSWLRWRVGPDRWSAWHFQPQIPDQSLACNDEGPAEDTEVELIRGVSAGLRTPQPPRCRDCERVARRLFGINRC